MPTSICAGDHVFIGMNKNIGMLPKFVTWAHPYALCLIRPWSRQGRLSAAKIVHGSEFLSNYDMHGASLHAPQSRFKKCCFPQLVIEPNVGAPRHIINHDINRD